MAEQELQTDKDNMDGRLTDLPFVKLFQGFRAAVQPGKLALALVGIVLTFIAGIILDGISSSSVVVNCAAVGDGYRVTTELDAFAASRLAGTTAGFEQQLQQLKRANRAELKRALMAEPMSLDAESAQTAVERGSAIDKIERKFKDGFKDTLEILEERYEEQCETICEKYEGQSRRDKLAELEQAYTGLFNAITGSGTAAWQSTRSWVGMLIPQADRARSESIEQDNKKVHQTMLLAKANAIARAADGTGVFASLLRFNSQRFHAAVAALIWQHDIGAVKTEAVSMASSACWLARFHWIYAIVLTVITMAIWSVFGGAICRMAALQIARQERIGPVSAVKFSVARFLSFFSAPLVPLAIVAVICVVTFLVGFIGAVPAIGEILAGLLMPLALLGGFIVALVSVGLIGGANLMYPTVAVEGSDSFDAISRSFSYVFARPWRMGFYTALAAVYGAICYIFVRFFTFLMLLVVHVCAGMAINLDGSSYAGIRGKLDAMWPAPTWSDLNPSVNWLSLGGTEAIGAFLMWIWVTLIVALVVAFLLSFYFSINTMIYYLLRQRVDGTDIEDVYVEQEAEETVPAEASTPDAQPQEPSSESPAQSDSPQDNPPPTGQADDSQQQTDEDKSPPS